MVVLVMVVLIMIIKCTFSYDHFMYLYQIYRCTPLWSMKCQWGVGVVYDLGDCGRTLFYVGFAVGANVPVPRVEVALSERYGPLSFCHSNLTRWSCGQPHGCKWTIKSNTLAIPLIEGPSEQKSFLGWCAHLLIWKIVAVPQKAELLNLTAPLFFGPTFRCTGVLLLPGPWQKEWDGASQKAVNSPLVIKMP